MGPLAQKLLRELRASRSRNVIDLQVVRDAKRFRSELQVSRQELEGHLPPDHLAWMELFSTLSALGQALLASRTLQKLSERISEAEDRYMPGGPPMSPVLDSVFMSWLTMDLGMGPRRETLFGMIDGIGPALGLPDPLREAARVMASSAFGVYRVRELAPNRVELIDLASDVAVEAQLPQDLNQRGALWLVRLLPPILQGSTDWVVWSSPHALVDATAEADWRAYFERLAPNATDRAARVARHFESPPKPAFWLDYILDGYRGMTEAGAIALSGVPDRPETLPQSDQYDPTSGAALRGEPPLQRVRLRLIELTRQRERRSERTDEIRRRLGAPAQPLDPHLANILGAAFAMFGDLDRQGATALDVLCERAETLPRDERDVLDELRAGWFSAFEILHVRLDEGLEVRDVLRRRRLWLQERSGTRQVDPGDLLAGWVMVAGERVTLEGGTARVPQRLAEVFVDRLRAVRDRLATDLRTLDWRQRAGLLAEWVVPLLDSLMSEQAPPRIVNSAGQEFVRAEAVYDVNDVRRARTELAALFEADGEGDFVHLEGDRLVAELRLEAKRLVVRCTSREDLQATRRRIERRLQKALRHRGDVIEDPTSTAARNAPLEPPMDVSPEVRELLRQKVLEHMRRWMDEPVPAFGNRTPRQAVRTTRGRDLVAHHLVRQAAMFDGNPQTAGIDLGEIWDALGLERPRA